MLIGSESSPESSRGAGKERRSSMEPGALNLGAGLGLSGLGFGGSSSPLVSPLQPGDGSFGGKSR